MSSIKLTIIKLDLVKSSSSTSVIEEELGVDGTRLFTNQIKEFVEKAFNSVITSSQYEGLYKKPQYDKYKPLGGDGYLISFQDVKNAYQFVETFCKSVEEHNTQAGRKKRIFRIGATTGNVDYDESNLEEIVGHKVLYTVSRLVTSKPGWFYVDKTTFDELPENLKQKFTEEFVKGKEHEGNIQAWRCQMIFDVSLPTPEPTVREINDKSGRQLLKGADNSRSQYERRLTDISNFVGREDEREKLKKWIVQENNRMIAIVGIGGLGKSALAKKFTQDEFEKNSATRNLTGGGIGKSSLVAKVTENIQDEFKDEFKKVIWLSLIDDPSIEEILKDLIKDVSDQRETVFSLEKLLFYIKENRYLIVLDNVETLMEEKRNDDIVGHFRTNRKEYEQMFESLILREHKSCFLLTSREIPQRILDLAGDKTRLVKILRLKGLKTDEGKQIFERFDCKVKSDDDWKKIVDFYDGNPLALELAASHIKQQYDGKISEFWNGKQIVFDNIEKLLDWHFNRLSIEAKEVMYWLAINREASSSDELSKDTNYATLNLSKFIQARIRQSIPLIEIEDEVGTKRIGLQPVILEFMIGKIIKKVCREIIQKKPDIFNTHALSKAFVKDSLRHTNNRLILIKIINKVKVLLDSGKSVTSEQAKREKIESVLTREGLFEELENSDDSVNKKDKELLNESLIQCLLNDANKDESLESKLMNIVVILKQQDSLKNRYAASNILNLLCQIQRKENEKVQNITLSDYDFSGLEIRQAYLRGINLPGVNFTECTFINSIFTQDFDRIKSLAFSPKHPEREKVYLLTGHSDKKARLWDVENGNLLFVCHEHTDWIRAVAFSPTCEFFATGSDDQTIRLWNLKASLNDTTGQGRCIGESLKGHTKWIWSLAFSPDDTLLASASADNTVKLWDVSDVKKTKFIRDLKGHKNQVLSISFSADAQFLASGSADKTAKLWNVKTRKCTQTFKGHTDAVESVSLSKDGRYLASGSKDATIKIWDLETGKCIKTFDEHQKQVKSVCFSPADEGLLVSGSSDGDIMLWNVNKLEYIKTLEGHTDIIEVVRFSHDGLMIASGGDDRETKLWSVPEKQCLRTLRGFTNWIWSVAFSPDDRTLASANGDWTVRLWDIEEQKECCLSPKEHTSAAMSVAFRKGGKILASCSDDQTIKLWSMEKDQQGSTKNLVGIHTNSEGHKDRIKCVCFSPDGSKLVSAGYDTKIILWDVEPGDNPRLGEHKELGKHENQIWSVVFSPDGKLLASCSNDNTIKLWDVSTRECLVTLPDHEDDVWSVAFNHDGTLLASGSEDKTVKLWDITNPKYVTCLHTLKGHGEWIWSVAFSPNGELVASGSGDNTVRLWDVKTGKCLRKFDDHKDCVWTVAFSHNSQILASGSSDETIKLWDVSDPRNANLKADLRAKRPYEDMNIRGAKWFTQSNTEAELTELTEPIKNSLKALGAVEN
jgi:WD40 repeat protein